MKRTPRGVWLSMANLVAAWWTAVAVAALRRHQRTVPTDRTRLARGGKSRPASRRIKRRGS